MKFKEGDIVYYTYYNKICKILLITPQGTHVLDNGYNTTKKYLLKLSELKLKKLMEKIK